MQFRDLSQQYENLKIDIDKAIHNTIEEGSFISGKQVTELENSLADYVGVKHCITCGNGTDALSLALMTWGIGNGDAVFVPDFTFFASGEVVSFEGATPIFVDVEKDTFNMSPESLEEAINKVLIEGKLKPKVVIAVDLFGYPADYSRILPITEKYNLLLLEDGAQGFGGSMNGKMACSFGDISTTSFFPAKPLGCYGDGGAVFTNSDQWAAVIRSLCIHGKGSDKYDNVRIGRNSRLDTMQASILQVKLKAFIEYELEAVNKTACYYTKLLQKVVQTPFIKNGFYSSWAQYSILLNNKQQRDELQLYLQQNEIPSMIYYKKPMHQQKAFEGTPCQLIDLSITEKICDRILSLPMHPYLKEDEQNKVIEVIKGYINNSGKNLISM